MDTAESDFAECMTLWRQISTLYSTVLSNFFLQFTETVAQQLSTLFSMDPIFMGFNVDI